MMRTPEKLYAAVDERCLLLGARAMMATSLELLHGA
jgi:hypothetical protein